MSGVEEAIRRVLFVGGYGYVTAVDKVTGDEIWRTSLRGSGYGFVNVVIEDNQIFAASGGKLYCLSPDSGDVIWTNRMPGLGYGIYSLATAEASGDNTTGIVAASQAAAKRRRSSQRHRT